MATTNISQETRDRLIEEHMALVRFTARKMSNGNTSGFDYDDLVSCGSIGLIQAVDRFDASHGAKLSSYAMPRIRGAIVDAMRSMDPVSRPSRTTARQIDGAFNTLALALGREPSAVEVQHATGMNATRYWNARAATSINVVSFDSTPGEEYGWEDRIADSAAPLSDGIEHRERIEALREAVASLPERERLAVSLHYKEGLTQKEASQVMGVSETRVAQILQRAYLRMRSNRSLTMAA